MTTHGSCACGTIKYEFTGKPESTALCHCTTCQKWTGSAYTSNAIVPRPNFRITTGSPKAWDDLGDSGKNNRHYFCGDCGSSLYTELEVLPDVYCVKGGGLDGGANSLGGKVNAEFYVKDRVGYLGGLEGVVQERMMG